MISESFKCGIRPDDLWRWAQVDTVSEPSNLKLQHLFTTPIIERVWENADQLNDELRQIILNKERQSPENRSNIGGWHSVGDLDQWAGTPGRELIRRIGELVNTATLRYYEVCGGKEPIRWRITT